MNASRTALRTRTPISVEACEARVLLTLSATLTTDGVLEIVGTGQSDTIVLRETDDDTILVEGISIFVESEGSNRASVDESDVSLINVRSFGGNDLIDLDPTGDGSLDIPSLVFAGSGSDTIVGTEASDTLAGNRGFDVIDGGEGDDELRGGFGQDFIEGGEGNDLLEGGNGGDSLDGDDDNDTLIGGAGPDDLEGADDDDVLRGGGGDDTLNGGDDSDSLAGGVGNDVLNGGEDDDTLNGGAGVDRFDFFGSSDDDTISVTAQQVGRLLVSLSEDDDDDDEQDTFLIDDFDFIQIFARGGDDVIAVGTGVVIGGVVNGGSGFDDASAVPDDGWEKINIENP